MGEVLQDYNLVSILKKQVDCCKKCIHKQKNWKPKQQQGKWTSKEKEDNNKQ